MRRNEWLERKLNCWVERKINLKICALSCTTIEACPMYAFSRHYHGVVGWASQLCVCWCLIEAIPSFQCEYELESVSPRGTSVNIACILRATRLYFQLWTILERKNELKKVHGINEKRNAVSLWAAAHHTTTQQTSIRNVRNGRNDAQNQQAEVDNRSVLLM
jgi:hypothetical protein